MEELRAADASRTAESMLATSVGNGSSTEQHATGKNVANDTNPVSVVHRVWGGDKRLSLYGYTLETINMLLLPMMQSKYVFYFFPPSL